MKQIFKKGKAGGTVLLTVVGVMMVMVVFLMATLGLTTSANRRSYYRYYEKQAQYAAQAALDTISNSAYNDEGFFNWLSAKRVVGEQLPITITVRGSDIQFTNKRETGESTIHCTAEYIGTTVIWDDDSNKMYEQPRWKLTATAHVGKGRNSTEASVTNYLYQNPVSATAENSANSVNYAYMTYGDEVEKSNPGGNTGGGGGSKAKAVYSLGANDGAAGGNMIVLGPISNNMGTPPKKDSAFTYKSEQPNIRLNNEPTMADDMFFNGHLISQTQTKFYFQHIGRTTANGTRIWPEGLTVMGDLLSMNGDQYQDKTWEFANELPSTPAADATVSERAMVKQYNQLNYIYVDGACDAHSIGFKFGRMGTYDNANDYIAPINLYAGTLKMPELNNYFSNYYGDIYLHNANGDSGIAMTNGGTGIARFVSKNINKSNYTGDYIGGDIICNNKSLTIYGGGGTIGGDIIMTNPLSTLTINLAEKSNSLTVQGSIVCAGKLVFLAGSKDQNLTADGGIYVDPGKVEIQKYINPWYPAGSGYSGSINEIQFGENSSSEYKDKNNPPPRDYIEKAFAKTGLKVDAVTSYSGGDKRISYTNSATSVHIESLGIDATGANYGETYKNLIQAARDKMQFDCGKDYLKSLKESIGNDYLNYDYSLYPYCSRWDEIFEKYVRWDLFYDANGNVGTDVYKKESEAANHTYVPYEACGYRYAACSSHDSAAHAFIPDRTWGTAGLVAGTDYFDQKDQFTGTNVYPTNEYSFSEVKRVVMGCHDSTGAYVQVPENCYVIEDSCVIDFSKMDIGAKKYTIFINPQGKSKPLNIVLRNNGSGANRVDIFINNTVKYDVSGGSFDYSKADETKSYTALKHDPGREQVRLYFEGTVKGFPKLSIKCSGIAKQITEGKIYVVSNPLYPTDPNWGSQSGAFKYAHELVPNVRVYGDRNIVSDQWGNELFIHGEILMPTGLLNATDTGLEEANGAVTVYFKENWNSETVTAASDPMVIGSSLVKTVGTDQASGMIVYIGDKNRGGSNTPPTYDYDDPDYVDDNANNGQEQGYDGVKHFSDMYQGAS